jgi:predicted PurR-regulated permease PerM
VDACPRCSTPIVESDTYCPGCGRSLGPPLDRRIPYRTILSVIWLVILSGAAVLLLIAIRKVLFEIVIAVFLALVVNPIVVRLTRTRLNRGGSIAIVVVTLTVGVLGIGTLIAAPLANQGVKFAQEAPGYLDQARQGKGPIANAARKLHLEGQLKKAEPAISNGLSKLSGEIVTLGRRVASAAFTTAIVIVLAIFMLVEGPALVEGFTRWVPEGYREAARRMGRTTSRVVSGYTLGVLFMAVLNGIVAGLALEITHTKFVLPLATWAAVVDILPIVGGLLAVLPAGLFAFAKSIPAGIVVVAAILIYQQVKNHVLYPIVVGRAVSLGSLFVLVSVLAGAELAGVAGAVLAIPVAGVLNAFVIEVNTWRAARRALVLGVEVPVAAAPATAEASTRGGIVRKVGSFFSRRRTGSSDQD